MHHGYQTKINKYISWENRKRVYHDYKVGDEFMLNNNSAFKYETSYINPFDITQCFSNGTVTLQMGAIKLGIIYISLSPIHLVQTFEYFILKTDIWTCHIRIYQLNSYVHIYLNIVLGYIIVFDKDIDLYSSPCCKWTFLLQFHLIHMNWSFKESVINIWILMIGVWCSHTSSNEQVWRTLRDGTYT